MRTKFVTGLVLTAVMSAGTYLTFAADTARVTQEDGKTAKIVAEMVSARHINHPSINDEISKRLLNRYIDVWDPQKLYFLQADIDGFNAYATQLDDQIRAGDVKFAEQVFERFLLRMRDRSDLIGKQIDVDHDFTVQEEMVLDPDDLQWAKDEAELADRWRKRIKFDLLMLKMDDTDLSEARTRLHKRYSRNRNLLEQTEPHEVLELYLSSLTHVLDPHSSYMSPQTLEDFQIVMNLQLEGIGARLKFDDGNTVVEEVIKGGAAATHGKLVKGDKIIGVDPDGPAGEEELVDVVEMKLSRVVEKIRGPKGTTVTLQVRKEAGGIEDYTMMRQMVKLTDQEVKGEVIETSEWIDGRPGKIGVLNIPSFYRNFQEASRGGSFKSTSRDVKKVLADFQRQGVDSLIVDLRWNGGGALSEAIEVSGLFIPKGPVVQVREPNNAVTAYDDEDPDMQWRKPMVVVCNRLSASASEIFAGAIKDYRRGIVVGDRTTHGKGTVQNVMNVTSPISLRRTPRGALKLTISKFYRVNGDSTQNKGVMSDIVLPSILNNRDIGEDSMDNALEFDRIRRAQYLQFTSFGNEDLTKQLAQRSQQRVSADPDFEKVRQNISRYLARKNRKTISLHEETLRKEEEEIEREREEEEETMKKASGNGDEKELFPKDFYNKELLNITLDYTEMLKGQQTVQN
ncbi:carboxy terminal-processing peptidase [Fuerstiella marisgermanici]|uniref:Tail-specific protease n=1 Tax=Fuerstiella marisgermanici TaxID=1891926 RepID=A0A1P8WMX8_9PLAN|nr:carboxy terminal-processing peptidase [Fuerstiella marisgermanici]APZ95432.1 Tail-specific protease precursor [Fuerstiella marisgermanici]